VIFQYGAPAPEPGPQPYAVGYEMLMPTGSVAQLSTPVAEAPMYDPVMGAALVDQAWSQFRESHPLEQFNNGLDYIVNAFAQDFGPME
jgi:hypothetical protein